MEQEHKKVSKKKFVRDFMKMQDDRKYEREEAELQAIIDNDQFSGYCNNKSYRGKKHTKQAYQC